MTENDFQLLPNGDRVVIKQIDVEEVSKGGIIIYNQDNNKELFHGIVVARGEGKRIDTNGPIEMFTNVGDIVMFKPQNGLEFTHKGISYFLLRDNEIAFRVTDKNITEKKDGN